MVNWNRIYRIVMAVGGIAMISYLGGGVAAIKAKSYEYEASSLSRKAEDSKILAQHCQSGFSAYAPDLCNRSPVDQSIDLRALSSMYSQRAQRWSSIAKYSTFPLGSELFNLADNTLDNLIGPAQTVKPKETI